METLTHTKRRDFANCPRYYFHRHEQRLVVVAQKTGRRRGTVFGDAIFSASMAEDKREAIEFAVDQAYLERWPQTQEEQDELTLEIAKLKEIAFGYVDTYGTPGRREVEFYLPLINPSTGRASRTFQLGGKIDGMVPLGDSTALLVEDKLVSSLQRAMIERLPLDAQMSEYVSALRARGWGAEVSYRHTRWPGINPEKAKEFKTKDNRPAETIEDYRERLAEDIGDRPEFYFDEQRLLFPDDHLGDYHRGRWGIAKSIMQARLVEAESGWQTAFPMNSGRCFEFGGCEFIPLCTKREGAIALYEETSDNPELSRAVR